MNLDPVVEETAAAIAAMEVRGAATIADRAAAALAEQAARPADSPADGSVVNKIGTAGLAVSARDRGVPVTVAAQTIKLHPDTLSGHTVEIEYRDESEVIPPEQRAALGDGDVEVHNPAFDVTPPRHVDAIVTERGQFPPESVVVLIRELFGDAAGDPWAEAEPRTDGA